MFEIKSDISVIIMGGVIAAVIVMLLGDYLGYKTGRVKLLTILGGVTLTTVVAFAIYAAVRLA